MSYQDLRRFLSSREEELTIGSCVSERVRGMNVVGGCMDEANFMISKGQVMNQQNLLALGKSK